MSYPEKLQCFIKTPGYSAECQRLNNIINFHQIPGPILDIGCGLGGMINYLEQSGTNVYGIDPGMHLRLINLQNKKVCQSCGENIPFADHTFGVVYFMHSFAHLTDPHLTLREVKRVLKTNGLLCLITPNSQFEIFVRPIKNVLEKKGKYQPDNTVTGHYTPGKLFKLLQSENFNSITVRPFGFAGFQRIIASARP
jgi:ubiquinone/menaquinone biosynthesis C-methylase UbiE